jgi:glycosyltransferase involved in cell wall biosynthesis
MSLSSPQVSIVMPVFNGGKDLKLAVQSVLSQSFKDWELIIIDDGSTDDAVGSLSHLADPRIQIIQDGQNRGLAVRLNQAIARARGNYVARMDHDDICHPDRLLRQVTFLQENPKIDLVATRCVTISSDNKLIGSLPFAEDHRDIVKLPWRGFYMPHPTWMAHIGWFRRFPYADPPPYRCEDQELLLRAYRTSTYHALPEPLLAYRVHANPSLVKLICTRIALGRVHVVQFWAARELKNTLQSLVMTCIRVGVDLSKNVIGRLLLAKQFQTQSNSDELSQYWESYISSLGRDAEGTTK